VLAYDEASLLAELGHEVFILGDRPGLLRPSINDKTNDACRFLTPDQKQRAENMLSGRVPLESWFVDLFDWVLIVSRNDWVIDEWEKVRRKKVIFRMIGQSDEGTQIRLKPFVDEGMEILGYSPHENKRFDLFSVKNTIRFYKDPAEWCGWHGNNASVMTSCQSIQRDGECCNPTPYREVMKTLPGNLYGPGNEDFLNQRYHFSTGVRSPVLSAGLSYEDLKKKYQDHRVYFYVGTRPASYTLNFIEAWMTGIPVVSLGPRFNTYEVCDLIDHGVNGFYFDDLEALKRCLNRLLADREYAKSIGRAGREKAIQIFGKDKIKQQWVNFLDAIAKKRFVDECSV
jgi:glycosyltransferase involved in cell wall biosynthesis